MRYQLSNVNYVSKNWLLSTVFIMMAGCQNTPQTKMTAATSSDASHKSIAEMLASSTKTPNQQVVKKGVEALLTGDYSKAGHEFNAALALEPTNSWLHYLNGLRYHMMARQGDVTNYDLAKAGYEQALKFEPTNVMASLQLGRVFAEQKDYRNAQNAFAEVLLIQPSNYAALYELACVAYTSGNIKVALMAVNQAQKLQPRKPEVLKAQAMILAAAGKSDKASAAFQAYQKTAPNKQSAKLLEGRVQDWRRLYQTGLVLAQAQADAQAESDGIINESDGNPPAVTPDSTAAADHAGAEAAAAQPVVAGAAEATPVAAAIPVPGLGEMVVFDAVVMRVSETANTTKGQNILDNFSLILAPGTYAYARTSTNPAGAATNMGSGFNVFTNAAVGAGPGVVPVAGLSVTKLFAQGISFGNVNYSLNIANAQKEHIEVVGRPSLVASIGKPAKFFSGNELMAGLSGQNGGNLIKTPIGVTLEVVPISIKDGKIIFDVTIYGSLLTDADLAVITGNTNISTQWSSVAISKINTSVEIALGETILLGGLTERIDEKNKQGFPFLQDIPFVQYLFSQEKTYSERKSVMYLITPRTYASNKQGVQMADLNFRQCPNLNELQMKHKDWYRPDYNMVVTMRHLAPLYREFRQGDLDPLQWDMKDSFEESLSETLAFLYY